MATTTFSICLRRREGAVLGEPGEEDGGVGGLQHDVVEREHAGDVEPVRPSSSSDTVRNVGTVDDVPAGVDVTFYEGTDASGLKLGTKPTPEPLPAGSSTDVVWVLSAPPAGESSDYYVEVDSGPSGGSIVECDENNNSALVTDAACPD